MKLAAHQPGYLPAISIFQKIVRADIFLFADDLQYSKSSNLNRAQIKNINGAFWLTVPILSKRKDFQKINCVQIDNHENWRCKHYKSLETNYRNTPYFYRYIDLLKAIYETEHHSLFELNRQLMDFLKKELFLHTRFIKLSEMVYTGNVNQRLIEIMKKVGCDTYIVEEFYRNFIDVSLYEKSGLSVEFIQPASPIYYQQFEGFISNLSIIDLLFNEGEMSREKLTIK